MQVLADVGLSPLARGNPKPVPVQWDTVGPIPARAGEPRPGEFGFTHSGAYPRSRGGTTEQRGEELLMWGLSPLARGNQEDVYQATPA